MGEMREGGWKRSERDEAKRRDKANDLHIITNTILVPHSRSLRPSTLVP